MPRRPTTARPHRRNGFWYLVRRVPAEFASVEPRPRVNLTTGIRIGDDPRGFLAKEAVAQLDIALLRHWRNLKAGRTSTPPSHAANVVAIAHARGLSYMGATDVAKLGNPELVHRIELLDNPIHIEKPIEVAAILGGEKPPSLMISQMTGTYEDIVAASLLQKSRQQLKKWRIQRDTATRIFIEAVGCDKPVEGLTRHDALALRAHWNSRIVNGEVEIDTANKAIGRIGAMFRAINQTRMLGLPDLFDKIVIRGAKKKRRVAFDIDFVQSRILADHVFDGLNPEARRIIYLVAETGLRLSEACNLSRVTIRLDHPVPHVQVRPDGREMKSDQSLRDIPLVGVALLAMMKQPEGFPRYRDKADSLSALVNKAMEARHLLVKDGQSLYSLRHTFDDRLTAAEAPEKVKRALMGHSLGLYGQGPSLEQKLSWLKRIAFRPPSSV